MLNLTILKGALLMEFTELTIRLLLIFFPGIIASLIVDSLTVHLRREFNIFLLNSFILGLTTYILLSSVILIYNSILKLIGSNRLVDINFLDYLVNKDTAINFIEIVMASVISIFLALIVSAIVNHKLLHRFAKKLCITKKFGQLDVWSYVFDSPDVGWIIVRDIDKDLMYQGWVEAFSDTYDKNEIFIREVKVYRNSTSDELYFMEGIYITRDQNNLVLEFPSLVTQNSQEGNK